MSTLLQPVGPRSSGVYWLRRLVVLVVLVALVLGVRMVFFSGGDDGSAGSGDPSASASDSASPSTSGSATGTASASSSAKPSASASGSVGACKDSQIQVTASTDAATYQVGATPRLRMRILNVSDSACKRDVGSYSNELIITSGTAHVWSSDDCNPNGSKEVVTLKAGQSYSVSVTWLGRLSKAGCPPDQPIASAGTYKLVGRNGKVLSDPAVFSLT